MTGWHDGDAERVPFTLLGGYLGAGKTTILNRLLTRSAARRIVVLVNDVGSVNVDAALVADHDGPTLTLTNGCVCCAIDDDFGQTLEQVRSLPARPDHVVMELSGVGEPARLVPWANTPGFRLDGVVVAVDADQFAEQLARRYVGDTVAAQVASADLVALTKSDLVGGDEIAAVLGRIASLSPAPVVDAAADPIEALLSVGGSAGRDPAHAPGCTVTTRVLDVARHDATQLARVVDALPPTVVRAKGLTMIDGVVHEIHVVGRRRQIRRRPDLTAGDGRLVVIELPP